MSVTTNNPFNGRLLQDAFFYTSQSITTAPAVFDLVQAQPYPVTDKVDVYLAITTGSLSLQDSQDNVTFSNISALSQPVISGVNSFTTASVKLEPNGRRYLRASGSVVGGTGTFIAALNF